MRTFKYENGIALAFPALGVSVTVFETSTVVVAAVVLGLSIDIEPAAGVGTGARVRSRLGLGPSTTSVLVTGAGALSTSICFASGVSPLSVSFSARLLLNSTIYMSVSMEEVVGRSDLLYCPGCWQTFWLDCIAHLELLWQMDSTTC